MDQIDKNTNATSNDDNDDEYLFADEIIALINEESNDECVNDGKQSITENNAAKHDNGLRLIDDSIDIFGAQTESENQLKCEESLNKTSDNVTVSELFGDLSDDEFDDSKQFLTKQGKEIELNLTKNKRDESNSLFKSSSKTKSSAKANTNNDNNNDYNSKVNDELFRDFFSGIRIINPQISSDDMKKRMEGRKMVKMSLIRGHINKKSNDIEGDWVTIGVVVEKLDTKTSKNGNQFGIWKLSDLKTDKVVNFFLFSTVLAEFWKLSVGTVLGLLNPKIMPQNNKDAKYAKKDEELCSITIDNVGKLMIMGTAKDLSFCKAVKNNGKICNALIGSAECQYCIYHTRTAYKKFSSLRAEIQNTFSNIEPNKAAMTSAMRYKEANSSADAINSSEKITLKKAKENERKTLTKVVNNPLSLSARNLAAHVNNVKTSNNNLDMPSKSFMTPENVFQMFRSQNQKKSVDSNEHIPAFARGCRPGDMISLTSVKSDSKLRAINLLSGKQLKPEDPNQIKKRPKSSTIDKIDAKVTEQLNNKKEEQTNEVESEEKQSKKLKRDFIDSVINRRSAHQNEVNCAENEAQHKYFTVLEAKEKLETKLLDTTEMECVVVTCKQCKYTAQTASELCKQKFHRLSKRKAIKRFFKCKNCKNRCVSFNIYPEFGCSKCGENSFEKTSISNIKTITSLNDEKLVISSENEPKFLNSLNK